MLKKLMNYPVDVPLFYDYLIKKGFNKWQLSYYIKSGWLDKVARGVYKRKGVKLETLNVIKAIQEQLSLPFIIGGKSSLALQGVSHFLNYRPKYYVYVPVNYRLNAWLKSLKDVEYQKNKMFKDPLMEVKTNNGIEISSRERALLEMADLVTEQTTYEEFMKTLEMLPGLRDDRIQRLLENCSSVKAKRLFLQAADKINHPWFKSLELKKIDLGKGPRQIVPKGVYDKKYNIFVPRYHNGV